jgi:hypothetical protein
VGHSALWHGRQPANVLLDKNLSDRAKVIYGIMTLKVFQGNASAIGVRHLAKLTGKSKSVIHRIINELLASGHVEQQKVNRGQRGLYILTSPVFGQKQTAGFEEVSQAPNGRKRMVSAPKAKAAAG